MFLPSCASFRSASRMPPLPLDTGADTLLLPNSSLYLSPRHASQFIIIYTLVRLPPEEDDFETRIQEQVICLGDEPRKYPLWAVRQGRQPIKRILLSKLPPRALSFILLRNQHRTHTSVIPLEGCGARVFIHQFLLVTGCLMLSAALIPWYYFWLAMLSGREADAGSCKSARCT